MTCPNSRALRDHEQAEARRGQAWEAAKYEAEKRLHSLDPAMILDAFVLTATNFDAKKAHLIRLAEAFNGSSAPEFYRAFEEFMREHLRNVAYQEQITNDR